MTLKEKIFYEKLSSKLEWKRKKVSANDYNTILTRAVLEKILCKYRGKVLNIGSGNFAKYGIFKNNFKEIHGMDISYNMIYAAKRKKIENVIVATADKLPYKDKYFDLIFSDQVLEHLVNLDKTLKEIARVGRQIVLCLPNEKLFTQRLIYKYIKKNPILEIGHVNNFSENQWKKKISKYLVIKKIRRLKLFNLIDINRLKRFHKIISFIDQKISIPFFSYYLIFECSSK